MPRQDWIPSLLATGLAALMIWLSGAPFAPPSAPAVELALLVPRGDVPEFPRRFAWSPVTGATLYEVFVSPTVEGSEPLFRQRGPSHVLNLTFDEGMEPAPGGYVWEVLALDEGRTIARAVGSFTVGSGP